MTTPPKHWKNRIVSSGVEAPENLLANPQNWRVHPKFQQDAVQAALDEIGWIQQVVVNEVTGHVIDGHLRVAVAISREEKAVPVVYVKLSPDEERLALATFDPLGALAVADDQTLQDLLKDVRPYVGDDTLSQLLADLAGGSVVHLGGEPDLEGLMGGLEEKAPAPPLTPDQGRHLDEVGGEVTDQPPDRLEALRARWGVEPGQVWIIPSGTHPGNVHTLYVDDCLDVILREPLNNAIPPNAVIVTSPPYGMGQDYEDQFADTKPVAHRGAGDRGSRDRKGGRPTQLGLAKWLELIERFTDRWSRHVHLAAINLADHTVSLSPGFARHTYGDLVSIAELADWKLIASRIWHKGPVWGNNAYWLASYKPVPEYEFVALFGQAGAFTFKPVSERVPQSEDWRFRSVWEFPSVPSQQMDRGNHPAAFPLELPRRCILLLTDAGGTVVDPFLGAGTTMVAAEALGRRCIGVEKDPTFAAMALERMSRLGVAPQKASGVTGVTESTEVVVATGSGDA